MSEHRELKRVGLKVKAQKGAKMFKKHKSLLAGILSVFVAFLIAFSAAPAFAEVQLPTDNTLVVSGVEGAKSVDAYRIIDAYLEKGELKYKFADGITPKNKQNKTVTIDEFMKMTSEEGFTNNSDLQFIMANIAAQLKGTPSSSRLDGDNAYFENLTAGQYLVLTTGKATDNSVIYQNTTVNVIPTAENNAWKAIEAKAAIKKSDITIEKHFADANKNVDLATSYQVGDKVPFIITTNLPQYPKNAIDKKFVISDTMTAGLKLDGEVTLKVDGLSEDKVAECFKIEKTDTTIKVVPTNKFNQFDGQKVTLEYSAVVTDQATFKKLDNNTVTLEFSNNSNVDESHSTKEDDVKVKTFGLDIKKIDKDEKTKVLKGAKFSLYDKKACTGKPVATGETNAEGKLSFDGLAKKTYWLKETEAPAGYVLLPEPVKIEIDEAKANEVELVATSAEVENAKTGSLPVTGGPGTVVLTVAGICLVAGAVSILTGAKTKEEK